VGTLAHRVVYQAFVGEIPAGYTIDHVRANGCTRTDCVNYLCHLEVVTMRENVLRGGGPSAINARLTHCREGHPFDEANTIRTRAGKRRCRTCRNARKREAYREAKGQGQTTNCL